MLQVPLLSNSDCQAKVPGNKTIQASILCAFGEGSGASKVGRCGTGVKLIRHIEGAVKYYLADFFLYGG